MSVKWKVESGQCRNCVAIVTPPSDEGGGKIFDFDGGRDSLLLTKSLPQSASQTAPSSEGAKEYATSTSQ